MVSIAGIILGGILSLSIYEKEAASVDVRFRTQVLLSAYFKDTKPFGTKEGPIDVILPNIPDSKFYYGFGIRRSRLDFRGHYITKALKYRMQIAFEGASASLLDFFTTYNISEFFEIKAGQYKIPYNREELNSSGELEFVDRSVINSYFALARDVGVTLSAGPQLAKLNVGVFTGWGRNFQRIDATNISKNLLYVGRIEITPVGKTVYSQPNLKGEELINIGIGGLFFPISQVEIDNKKISSRRDKPDILKIIENKAQKENLLSFTGDVKLWLDNKLSFETEAHFTPDLYDNNLFGIRIQPSFMLTEQIGLAARFSTVLSEKDKPIFEPGIAFSYYFKDHTKLQLDYINQRGPKNDFAYIRAQFQVYIK